MFPAPLRSRLVDNSHATAAICLVAAARQFAALAEVVQRVENVELRLVRRGDALTNPVKELAAQFWVFEYAIDRTVIWMGFQHFGIASDQGRFHCGDSVSWALETVPGGKWEFDNNP